ncbi:unnamed protein product [Arctogadus glacialis]
MCCVPPATDQYLKELAHVVSFSIISSPLFESFFIRVGKAAVLQMVLQTGAVMGGEGGRTTDVVLQTGAVMGGEGGRTTDVVLQTGAVMGGEGGCTTEMVLQTGAVMGWKSSRVSKKWFCRLLE